VLFYQIYNCLVIVTHVSSNQAIMISKQSEVNVMMSEATRTIPAKSLYTAMPQLISRVNHRNSETALVIHGILSRVLMKFPGQAVWTLTWLRNSANKDRARIGDFIFKNAQDGLVKRKQKKMPENAFILGETGKILD